VPDAARPDLDASGAFRALRDLIGGVHVHGHHPDRHALDSNGVDQVVVLGRAWPHANDGGAHAVTDQGHACAQRERIHEVDTRRHADAAAACPPRLVNGRLHGGRVVRHAITDRAEVFHAGGMRGRGEEQQGQQQAFHGLTSTSTTAPPVRGRMTPRW